jgi:predicted HicB family RNase H-like nuclease
MSEMKYKSYIGSLEVSEADDCLYGKLLHINDLVTYEADTPKQLKAAFIEAVDEYLADCAELEKQPDTPYKGLFNVRTSPTTHRNAATVAATLGGNLNSFANMALVFATTVAQRTYVDAGKGKQSIVVVKFDQQVGDFVVEPLARHVAGKKTAARKKLPPGAKAKAKQAETRRTA